MRKGTLSVVGLVALILGGIAIYVALSPTPPRAVSVGFIGYTNDVSGRPAARFAITNGFTVPIKRMDLYNHEELELVLVHPGTSHSFGSTNRVLAPGQSEVIIRAVPALTSKGPWRAVFLYHRHSGGWTSRMV